MLTIASLTLREAVRRRVALTVGIAGALLVALSGWGFWKLNAVSSSRLVLLGIDSGLVIFLAFVFSVVLSVGAAFLAAPAIAGDVDGGIALAILPRPLSRAEFVVGKWLGLALLVSTFAATAGAVEFGTIFIVAGYRPPHPAIAVAYLTGQSLVLLTFALALSTRLPAIAAGILSVACFGTSWIAGIAVAIASALHNEAVVHVATLIGLIFPSDGLWRGAVYALEPVVLLAGQAAVGGSARSVSPFGVTAPPSGLFLAWCALWTGSLLATAAMSFARRDV